MITQQELKKHVSYNSETGIFTWKIHTWKNKIGRVAGSLNGHGYVLICIKQKSYSAHRLAFLYMTGQDPKNNVDHINLIKNDNRWINIRNATYAENRLNTGMRSTNTSGYRGAYKNNITGNYQARAYMNGKSMSLGTYKTAKEANEAYENYAKLIHGNFYCLTAS
jgi:HNH endonuclease/AP2 domain